MTHDHRARHEWPGSDSSKYHNDVAYELWRSGHGADTNPDRVADYRDRGLTAEQAASAEIRRLRLLREQAFERDEQALDAEAQQGQDQPDQGIDHQDLGHRQDYPGAL